MNWLGNLASRLGIALVLLAILTGCLYPDEERKENQVAAREFIVLVQSAVDQYRTDTGLLPIKNSELDTPIYEKYVIDFKRLKTRGYMSQIPANAYENGGNYYYVLVDVENQAKVKLMDLVSVQKAADLQMKIDAYRRKHGQLPLGEQAAPQFFHVDFQKIGTAPEQIRSVYSKQYLGFLLHESGRIAIDYGIEIRKAISKAGLDTIRPNEDLRAYLVEQSVFVPVRSYPYYLVIQDPVISAEKVEDSSK